jgi:enoyl-CoA hydratase/carnithine racemase
VSDQPILVERRGRVGIVTMNRPEKLNALNSALVNQLDAALHELEVDPKIGAIVLTGAGERAFSAGGDMAEQIAALNKPVAFRRVNASAVVRAVRKSTIAAIRGYCFGGGALLSLECDIDIDEALELEQAVSKGMGRTADSAARFRSAAERVIGRH